MSISELIAIDVHGHYGEYRHPGPELANRCMTGDADTVVARAKAARIGLTIASPLSGLLPRGGASAFDGNEEASRIISQTKGLLQYVIVNPLEKNTYDQARRLIGRGKCVGIKIHPEEHGYAIAAHGREIFEFAAEFRAIVLTHSGERRSLPDDYLPFANDFPQVSLILAHIGCSYDSDPGRQVRAMQKAKHDNVYADTSSAKSIMPGLIEWAVAEVGAGKILFGTDTPLYFAAMQRARIDHAEMDERAKSRILRDNALELFGPLVATHWESIVDGARS